MLFDLGLLGRDEHSAGITRSSPLHRPPAAIQPPPLDGLEQRRRAARHSRPPSPRPSQLLAGGLKFHNVTTERALDYGQGTGSNYRARYVFHHLRLVGCVGDFREHCVAGFEVRTWFRMIA